MGRWCDLPPLVLRSFLPFIRRSTSSNVALLMDNCGSHGKDLVDIREQVTIFTLPPNCTSVHQPRDMGVISAWKSRYHHTLLRDRIVTMETREQRKRMAIMNKLTAGMRGLGEGHDPHMLDVSELVACTWKQVSERTISRCWIKLDIIPVGVTAYCSTTIGARAEVKTGTAVYGAHVGGCAHVWPARARTVA